MRTLSIARELGFKTVNLDHYCGYAEMGKEMISSVLPDISTLFLPEVTGLMIHLPLPAREIMYMAVERPMTKACSRSTLCHETASGFRYQTQ